MSWSMRLRHASVPSRLAAAGRGDQAAFGSLVHDLAPRLMALGQEILRCPKLTEDVLTRALVDAWRRAPTYDERREDAETWFTTLMHRHVVDALRTTPPTTPTASRPRDRHVAMRLATLPESPRRCLELAWFEGRTVTDLARQSRSDHETACRHLNSGLRSLSHRGGLHPTQVDEAVRPAAG